MKNPKSKGNSFENRVAKDLSMWVTNGDKKDVLMRAPTSGARTTVLARVNEDFANQAGDIVAVAEEGTPLTKHFIIECKHRRNLRILGTLLNRAKLEGLLKFWLKLLEECNTHNKKPLLIARQNNYPVFLGLNAEGLAFFELRPGDTLVKFQPSGLYLMLFDTFLKIATPELLTLKK